MQSIELPLNESFFAMSFLSRLLGKPSGSRADLVPLWHRTVAIAREREWYADCGVADSVEGRFDMVVLILATILLRLEREPELKRESVLLTELFIEDMDGQLRNSGVGDLVVGKHMGKLMGALGGRLGALRQAYAANDESQLAETILRNVSLRDGNSVRAAAARLRAFEKKLSVMDGASLIAADFSA